MTAIGAVQSLYSPSSTACTRTWWRRAISGFAKRLAFISVPFVFGGTALFFVLSEFIMLVLGGTEYLRVLTCCAS